MKSKIQIIVILLLSTSSLIGQNFNSINGKPLYPNDTVRSLNIFINIIYDLNPELNPFPYNDKDFWRYDTIEGINQNIPTYLTNLIDTAIGLPNGLMTRIFHESSFGMFYLLGDFIIVNIKQSRIQTIKGADFTYNALIDSTIEVINLNGGFSRNILFKHLNLDEYDHSGNINSFDLVQFFIRNSRCKETGYNFASPSECASGHTSIGYNLLLDVDGTHYIADLFSYQQIGPGDVSKDYKFTPLASARLQTRAECCKSKLQRRLMESENRNKKLEAKQKMDNSLIYSSIE